ncbi:MAG: haloacid dehalogenase [Chromatiales bacterium]|jgi:putative hydrolase of the HAD superfamily|nr:haloacid dehalogenase [Chromatiales bacterium]
MDGTLLDLAFDNYFWRELIPRVIARRRNITEGRAREHVFELYADKEGTLDWYCLDFWGRQLELDLVELKTASSQRIRFLPGAREFLQMARDSGKRLVLVTNAHQENLNMKKDVAGLTLWIDEFVSSHDIGAPKEKRVFWERLQAGLGFDPAAALFVDDSQAVLDAAAAFGIGSVIGIRCPDSRMPGRDTGRHPSIDSIAEWL